MSNALSICFVSQEYPDETGWGGIGTYTYEMAHAQARLGHSVTVLSRALESEQQYSETDGVEIHRILPSLNLDSVPVAWRLNRWWEGYRLAVARKLKQLVRDKKIDLIESPELHAEPLLFARGKGRPPIVVRLHSGSRVVAEFESDSSSKHAKFASRFESWLISRASVITSPSRALQASLNGELGSRSLAVIPNPVDIDHFKPLSNLGSRNAQPNILCVGRPRLIKGIHVLAKAMPLVWGNVPNARFTFVPAPMGKNGGSPLDAYREFLGKLVEDERVQILHSLSRTELPDIYRAATVCVVPSLWEGFGYVAAEAMACGVPVVASRTGGLAEMIEHEKSGLLVEPLNERQLADAIVRVTSDVELRTRYAAAGRKRAVEQFSSSSIAVQMADVYRKVILDNQRERASA